MKFNLLYTGFLALGLMATSCTDDSDYPVKPLVPADPTAELEVYFYPANTSSYTLGEGDTELTVDVYRSAANGAKTYDLSFESDKSSLFSVPQSVTFAADETKTTFAFNFNAVDFPPLQPVDITFVIGDGVNTHWAYQRLTYTLTYEPWEDVVGPEGETEATWVDDIIGPLFGWPEQCLTWSVKLQKSPAIEGLYRVVTPYGKDAFPGLGWDTDCYDGDVHYMYFNCKNPKEVFVCNESGSPLDGKSAYWYYTGIILNGYDFEISGMYNNNYAKTGKGDPSVAGILKDGVLKFPVKSLLAYSDKAGGALYTNPSGKFRLIWPGAKEAPEETWESIGTAQYTDVVVVPMFNNDGASETWNVEVEQLMEDPNMFRMVNPYKDGVMPNGWNYDGDKYVVLDASNPQCVYVDPQVVWYDEDAKFGGDMYICNKASFLWEEDYTDSNIIADGFNDVFENKTFTFAVGHLGLYLPESNDASWKNTIVTKCSEAGKLVLSDDATVAAAANRSRARSFNFDKVVRKTDVVKLDSLK